MNYPKNSWKVLFDENKEELNKINDSLIKTKITYPERINIFRAFELAPLDSLTTVILGQDPYPSYEIINKIKIPQATGLAFSVPKEIKIPSSLKNIFRNLYKYKHINKYPEDGDLTWLAKQNVLLLNTSLTVEEDKKLSHSRLWQHMTDTIINYISNNKSNIVFVLWGAHAVSKKYLIDESKHKIIISSHPSGLSCNKKLGIHPEFNNTDWFGEANIYLEKHKKQLIKITI